MSEIATMTIAKEGPNELIAPVRIADFTSLPVIPTEGAAFEATLIKMTA